LILNFINGLRKDNLLSEEQLSSFLNDTKNAKLISAYAAHKYNPDTIFSGVKESLGTSIPGDGFHELLKCESRIIIISPI
jgi:hypothetical protein